MLGSVLVLVGDAQDIRGLDLVYWVSGEVLVWVVEVCQHLYRESTILLRAGGSAGFEIVWWILGDEDLGRS